MQTGSGGGLSVLLLQMAAIGLVFYFLILRPSGQARKKHAQLLSNLKKPPVDPPSGQWLGLKTTQSTIRNSGLWNTNHVDAVYDATFIGMFRDYISRI